MVKKSKKSKSKRVTLKQKYKVLRKVKEHHRKKAKEAKNLGLKRKKKVEKDPGIPNDWPFKEQELKALEARRARALDELEQKKAARKERAKKRKLGLLDDEDISKLADIAGAKEESFHEEFENDDLAGTGENRDNSDRAFYNELAKVIEASDVILEVLDARDPLGTRCTDMEKMVMKAGPDKRLVLLLNKIVFPLQNFSECHVVNVGSTPGLTRSMQEVQLDKNVKLLDCPGVVMLRSNGNDAAIALRNCKRIEKLDDLIGPVKEIIKLCPERILVTIYKIPSFHSVEEFLQNVATVRGKLKKGGIVDVDSAARIVLHDWNEGKIPYYTMPPTRNQEHSEARIVTEFGKEFNVDEIYNKETSFIGSLKSADDLQPVEIPPSYPINFDETMLEDNNQAAPLTQAEERSDDGEDESMATEEDHPEKAKTKSEASKQNEKLYAAEGMLNPRTRRAEKKRRKKANKLASMDDSMDADYDFKVDYAKRKGSAADEQIIAKVPMLGIEFDDE